MDFKIKYFFGSMGASVASAQALFMFIESSRDVGGDPGINTFISAFEEINKIGHVIKLAFLE